MSSAPSENAAPENAALPPARTPGKRNAAATRQRILDVALAEFAEHGFSGSRIERIAAGASANVGMIYHYFGNKDDLYLAALEASYKIIRDREQTLDIAHADPRQALKALVELTFDFLSTDPHFVRLIMNENLMMGRTAQRSATIPHMTRPLLEQLRTLLARGQKEKIFHREMDAEDLYISILGLCFIHVSNRYTLGSMFQHDFAAPDWLARRKAIVVDVVTRSIVATPAR
ncbi:TetR family transcriptional regulator [Ancylobacter vacuolatus]|uniref:AcrR family transcriptional regulator n=1 Tax=Ancylobacter vacuolatus TaxID=223389 RepID=A0ABU0DL40_9HYPH|nr:TetR family transcriptional regulator [Ancylobacter vacuolatus]MDQ0349124.1 AcrR family transcriptional regulator [Ancylobacter vacuolatus]